MKDQLSQLTDAEDQSETERIQYEITDLNNPHAVINLVDKIPTIFDAILRLLAEDPDLLSMDEGTIKNKTCPSVTLMRIRMSFWSEYELAVSRGRRMKLSQIIGGICTELFFKKKILDDNMKVAFMLTPPSDYVVQVKESLQAGMETLRQIVSAKIVDDDGYLIPRAAEIVLKTVALLDMRVKGAIVQRVDQRTINYNKNEEVKTESTTFVLPRNLDELERELNDVRDRLALASPRPHQKDLTINMSEAREEVPVNIERVAQTLTSYRIKND